ncbi:hypothetical protein OKA05_21620 [Luteolibacter arcticus]|uniref:Sigma-70 family RNA polymerase sigma factor n=1 Tax=Luteolibacter arcticus TaxID=1581411 RepID=A0ABT3GNT0_9BACT|nr:hypothetical protein [Luteolibacter arcticus]MCW1925174.1 hypothetical protein [Luteolibacter arcticus]
MNRSPAISDELIEHLEWAELALEGDPTATEAVMKMLRSDDLVAALRSRGASETEAADILGDLAGDCFGGERAKGGLHRLLGRYNGACPLPAFFRHVAVNRLITLKRKQALRPEASKGTDDDEDPIDRVPSPASGNAADETLIPLLRDAVVRAFQAVDVERMVVFRLVHSYGVPQKRVGAVWGWHESKTSRALDALREDLKTSIIAEIRRADPWLQLEWDDFLSLCGESIDLFAS